MREKKYDEIFLSNSIKLKNKIIDYDLTHERTGPKSEYQKEKEKKEKEILFKAKRDREENLDEVKTMNSILLTAKYAGATVYVQVYRPFPSLRALRVTV